MAGTLAVTYSETRAVKKINMLWISDGAGAVSGSTKKVSGRVVRVTIVPSIVDVPTENYTMQINDADGIDILMGYGSAGLSATIKRTIVPRINDAVLGQPSYPVVIDGNLSFVVAGAGALKAGTVSIYIEQ